MKKIYIKGKRVLAFILVMAVCITGEGCNNRLFVEVCANTPTEALEVVDAGEIETSESFSVGTFQLDTEKKQIILNGNAVIFCQNEDGENVLYLDRNRNGLVEAEDTLIAVENDETIKGSFANYAVYGVLGQETSYAVDMVIDGVPLGAIYGVKDGTAKQVKLDIKGTPVINTVVAIDNGYCGNAATLCIEDASDIDDFQLAVKAVIGGVSKISAANVTSISGSSIKTLCQNSSLYGTLTASITNTDSVIRVLGEKCTAYTDVIIDASGDKRGFIYGNYGADIKGNLSCLVSGNLERLFALMNGTVQGDIRIEAKEYCGDIYGSYRGSVGGNVRLALSDCLSKQNIYGAWEGTVKKRVILDSFHCSLKDTYGVYKLYEECKGVEMYFDDTVFSGDVYGAYGTNLAATDGQAIMLSLIQCSVQYLCAERDCGEIEGTITLRGNKLTRNGYNNTLYVARGTSRVNGDMICRLSGEIDDFYGIVDGTQVTGNLSITLLGDDSAISTTNSGNKYILQGNSCVVGGNVIVRMQQQSANYFYGNSNGVILGDFKLTVTGGGYISSLSVNTGSVKGDVETVLSNVTISYNLSFNLGEIKGSAVADYSLLGEMSGSYIGNRGAIEGVYDVTVGNMSVSSFFGNEGGIGQAYNLKIYCGTIGTFSGTATPVKQVCIDRIGGDYIQGAGINASGGVNGYDNDRGDVTFHGSYQLEEERSFETATVIAGARLTVEETGALRVKQLTNSGVLVNCGTLVTEEYKEQGPLYYYAGKVSMLGQQTLSQCRLIYYPVTIETSLADAMDSISVSSVSMEIDNKTQYFSLKDSLVTMHVMDEEHYYLEQIRVRNKAGEQLPCRDQSFVMPEEAVDCELICRERHVTQPEGQQNIFVDDITKKITVYHDNVLIKKLPNGNTAVCDGATNTILYEGDLSAYHVQLQAAEAKVKLHKVVVESGELASLCGLQGASGTVEQVELVIAEDACINKVYGMVDSTITGSLLIKSQSSQIGTITALSGSNVAQGYLVRQKEHITVGGDYCFHEDIESVSLTIEKSANAVLPKGITIAAQDISINGALDIRGKIKADNMQLHYDLTVKDSGELFVEDTLSCQGRVYLMGQITAEHVNNTNASNAILVMGGALHNTDGIYVYYPYTLFWNQEQIDARYNNFDSNTIIYQDIRYGKRGSNVKIYAAAKPDYQIDDIRVNGVSQYKQQSGYITITMPDEETKLEVIGSAIHEWGAWTVEQEADCDTQGRETATCTLCGETKQRAIPALGHLYSEEWELVTPATTAKAGKAIHRCQRENCQNPEQIYMIPAMSYRFEDEWCVYDGKAHIVIPEIITPSNVTVRYSLNDGEYKAVYPELIEAGCYKVGCKMEAVGYETVTITAKLTIYRNQTEEQGEIMPPVNPTTQETTTEETSPTTQEQVPTTEEKPATTEQTVPTTEEKPATTEQVVPTTEEKSPTTEQTVPTTEEKSPTTEQTVPTTEEKPATTEQTAPTTEEKPATTEQVVPTTEEKPATTEQAVSTAEDKTTTEQTVLTTEDKSTTAQQAVSTTEDKSSTIELIETSTVQGDAVTGTMVPAVTEAARQKVSFSSGNLHYRIVSFSEKTVAITGYKKAKKKLIIPAKVTYQGVVYGIAEIDKKAFYKNKKLRKVTIKAKKIKRIGKLAFCKKNRITFLIPKGTKKTYKKLLKQYGIVK